MPTPLHHRTGVWQSMLQVLLQPIVMMRDLLCTHVFMQSSGVFGLRTLTFDFVRKLSATFLPHPATLHGCIVGEHLSILRGLGNTLGQQLTNCGLVILNNQVLLCCCVSYTVHCHTF